MLGHNFVLPSSYPTLLYSLCVSNTGQTPLSGVRTALTLVDRQGRAVVRQEGGGGFLGGAGNVLALSWVVYLGDLVSLKIYQAVDS